MTDYTPTTEEVRAAWIDAHRVDTPLGGRMDMEARPRERIREFDRWMASVLAEQGEPEGRRWFSAAYRGRNGNVIPIGDENTLREFPEAIVEEFRREDPDGPEYFLASRILPPWLPEENGENDG